MLVKETKAEFKQARKATCHPRHRSDPHFLHKQENRRRPKVFYSDGQHHQPATLRLQKAAPPSVPFRALENEQLYRNSRLHGWHSGVRRSSA